jgi:hypothetical protein
MNTPLADGLSNAPDPSTPSPKTTLEPVPPIGDVSAMLPGRPAAKRRATLVTNTAWIGGITAILICLLLGIPLVGNPWQDTFEFVVVAGLSGLVAYGELLSRYKDSPIGLFSASPTPIYILVNVAAGLAAIVLVRQLHVLDHQTSPRLYEILLASFGAIAFFRTSLFTIRVGGSDIGIGPAALLQSLLDAADMMIDRDQAQGRAEDVADTMTRVNFDKAQLALPTLCFTLVQNLTADDQKNVADQIKNLAATDKIAAESKTIILGVYLIRLVGADVLLRAVRALGKEIT